MKILIADDEKNVRLSLRSMLNEINVRIDRIIEAENGEKLLLCLHESKPDIAFVDIKMPKLSGLDAIKEAKAISPNTKWIILTGFAEFDFARKAVDLGVSKYLLKPVSIEILKETLMPLLIDSSADYSDMNKKFERDMIALYNNYDPAHEMILETVIKTARLRLPTLHSNTIVAMWVSQN